MLQDLDISIQNAQEHFYDIIKECTSIKMSGISVVITTFSLVMLIFLFQQQFQLLKTLNIRTIIDLNDPMPSYQIGHTTEINVDGNIPTTICRCNHHQDPLQSSRPLANFFYFD